MANIVDYLIDFGMNLGRGKLKDIKEEKEIHKLLQDFIERQSEINEYSSLAEEIDFQGFCDYVNNKLVNDFENYLFANYKDREKAKETIISKALYYAQALNESAKQKVIKLINFIADILGEFYINNISRSELILKRFFIDDVSSIAKETESSIISKLSEINDVISANSILSIDNNIQQIRIGNFNEVESNLNTFLNCIGSVQHILHPYYKYSYIIKNEKLRFFSKPLSSDSIKKYPPKIKCTGSIKIGNKYLNELNTDVIDYANRHQLPITFSIVNAKKFLGDDVDPLQHEAEELIGEELVILPKPFPAAFPCSIILDGKVEFDYILLRTEEILEDGTYIISNKEQKDFPFRIRIYINTVDNKTDFNIRTENPSNIDLLHYVQFMKKVSCGGHIVIKALSIGKNIMEGKLNSYNYKSGFESIDDEISFLEKVVSIENHFKKTMVLPDKISEDDYEAICYMANLIRGEGYRGKWTGVSFEFILSEDLRNKIISTEESLYNISHIADSTILLYGEKYQFTIRRTYECGKIKNLDRLKKKAEVLDVGDKIRMEYIPKDEIGIFIDNLYDEATNEIKES